MAKGAGDAMKGIYGTANWDWQLPDDASKAFTKSFGAKFGRPPSQAAHLPRAGAALCRHACERAGTFYPPEVIKALEGVEVRRHGEWSDQLPCRRPSVLQGSLCGEGQGSAGQPVRPARSGRHRLQESVTYDPSIFGGELGLDTAVAC